MGKEAQSVHRRERFTQIRVRRATHARLVAFRDALLLAAQEHRGTGPQDFGGSEPSLDWVCNWLIDQVEAHRQRAARQRARKREESQEKKT